jgi:hypothetical protein
MLHEERGVLLRVVMSPREGEASKLGLQASLSCLGVSARPGMVFVLVSLPRHGAV